MSSPRKSPSPDKAGRSPTRSPEAPGNSTDEAIDNHIEVDDDTDSTYSEGTRVTDTQSLRSSILNYKWENGRRYHAYNDGEYWAPNDDRQQDAEDLMHEMFRIILDGNLYEAPISDTPQAVLDLGCGTGIWAIEFADEHPSAEVIGVDLSPIQPSFVPPNCKFEVDDINQEWTYPTDNFDFIHIRSMTGCIPDWIELHKKALRTLKPGGFIEHVELWGKCKSDDGSLKPTSPLYKWVEVFEKIGELTGKTFFYGDKAADAMREAGLSGVSERRLKLPLGPWPKDKKLKRWGAWNRQFLLQALEGFSIRGLTEMLGWSFDDAQLFLVDMRNELLNPNVHAYGEVTIIYGQKPENET
ncbi:S-adenosyl-L-methionine-dependent methyltransferase [Ilyonectria robusta]|uniref:S-adenosyl-L-methionine-dependent methyltransferase n=1 Tax=Ilyonectria robusta TaxID=1079257 RepID=UPI001E8D4615|nr:S-adenosyl-L-methionine-dependent methyltransferase [Ilyonectria robusta]KAH8736219.1 S-adenosyl-L-methionine-dependent methyltransferase [Ilyonectria robusta]